ncbi:unnamed protein product, partial [Prorocentrum cordatum]
ASGRRMVIPPCRLGSSTHPAAVGGVSRCVGWVPLLDHPAAARWVSRRAGWVPCAPLPRRRLLAGGAATPPAARTEEKMMTNKKEEEDRQEARDLDIVDSSAHFERPMELVEPTHHICRVTASTLLEIEVEAACCSQAEWQTSPLCQDYERSLRHEGWLIVPALFSPVMKVNYRITGAAVETVELEVWTRPGTRPSVPIRAAAASLLAGLAGRPREDSLATAAVAPKLTAAPLALEGSLGNGGKPGGKALDEMISQMDELVDGELVDE